MKLIGAGLPRTATLTQKIALEMLGFGPCYHMVNVLGDLSLVPLWRDALEGRADWDEVFAGFQSTVDWPGSYYYKELAEHYPDAKVLLSVRSPDSWERSMRNTIVDVFGTESLAGSLSHAQRFANPPWDDYLNVMGEMWSRFGVLNGGGIAREGFGELLTQHTEAVKRDISAERLLIWDPKEGWEPLCRFLEVPVPETPLPHVNDSAQFVARVMEGSLAAVNSWWAENKPSMD